MENSLVNVDIAVAQYIKSKNRVLKYNKEHPEKLKVWQKTYYDNLKLNHPEKYQQMLDKKREKYLLKKQSKIIQ